MVCLFIVKNISIRHIKNNADAPTLSGGRRER